jgi:hypothetical protein
MTRGQCGSLLLHCVTLSFTTSRRLLPAHGAPSLCEKAGSCLFGFAGKGGRDRPSFLAVRLFQTDRENKCLEPAPVSAHFLLRKNFIPSARRNSCRVLLFRQSMLSAVGAVGQASTRGGSRLPAGQIFPAADSRAHPEACTRLSKYHCAEGFRISEPPKLGHWTQLRWNHPAQKS